jgi:signal transduction histidine kinase
MAHDNILPSSTPFRPVGTRLVRKVVMLAAICALAAMALQTAYGVRNARIAFDDKVREITRSRVPMLSTALWDIEPKLAQAEIDDIATTPQIAGVQLVTAGGIRLHAGHSVPNGEGADAALDIPPPSGGGSAVGRLYLTFDYDYLIRQVLVKTALTALFIGLFTVVLCLLLIRFLRVEIGIPLQRLSQHVNAMSPDALNAKYSSGRSARPWRDELDQLAEGFASLHGGIARYVDERNRAEAALASERDQLEAKVVERTHDLAAARDLADRASRSKSEFLANMSHEIRTPINAIAGFTTLVMRTELNARQHAYLDKINAATKGLLLIINDVLDFSKIEAGHLDMERIPFRLCEVLDTMVAYVGPLAERKGLELLIHAEPDLPQQWVGDPLRLGQILVNLCGNAVKFTEDGEVEVRVMLESQDADCARLLFSVRDTGIGLNPEQAARLFQAFSQADASTTRKFGGTGLGLAISQRLVGMMNGRIWLESRLARGTTFFFEVELGVAQAGAKAARQELPSTTMPMRVNC